MKKEAHWEFLFWTIMLALAAFLVYVAIAGTKVTKAPEGQRYLLWDTKEARWLTLDEVPKLKELLKTN